MYELLLDNRGIGAHKPHKAFVFILGAPLMFFHCDVACLVFILKRSLAAT